MSTHAPGAPQAHEVIRDATGESRYRVWPDGTVQEADETPYEWMSDDYRIVYASSEEEAANEQ